MKAYSVKLVAQCDVVINAKDESEAMEIACDYVSRTDYQFEEATAEEIRPDSLDSYKRHANVVIPDSRK